MYTAYKPAFRIGCALNEAIFTGQDKAAKNLVINHFNTITAENAMKAEVLHPAPGVYNFSSADSFVHFGMDNNLFIVGHTLVWHNQCPPWFFIYPDGTQKQPDTVKAQLKSYIQTVAGHFSGMVQAWDVVNEVIDNDGSYRPTTWVKGVGNGDELVQLAFLWASESAPGTELYYNDFNTWRPSKRDGIMRMVRMLQSNGIRIDGIGMQGHWGLNYPDLHLVEAAIDSFASLGVKVMITELDIDVLPFTQEGQVIGTAFQHEQFQLAEFEKYLDPYKSGLPKRVEKAQAFRYNQLFKLFLNKKDKIDRVTLWGLHDRMSWKNNYPIPERTNYPLLWAGNLTPKKAYYALIRAARRI